MSLEKVDKKLLVDLELVNQRLKELDSLMVQSNEQMNHLNLALSSLDAKPSDEDPSKMLVPLGGGVFLPVKADSFNELFVSVGAGVVVKKSFDETKSYLEKNYSELATYNEAVTKEYDFLLEKALKLQEQIEVQMK